MDEDDKPKLNVISFKKPEQTETEGDINVDMVLDAAKGNLKAVIVAGWTKDGGFYFAMSQGAISENLMILETSKAMLVEYILGGIGDD